MMGSYGIGPARIVAAAIEQGADEQGIVWPPPIAPWDVHLVALGKAGERGAEAADRLYEELRERRASRSSTTTATPARARSSPTPSCSAARCGSWSAAAASPRAWSRRRCARSGAEHRLAGGGGGRRGAAELPRRRSS